MGQTDKLAEFADALVKAREEEEARYGIPVDDFPMELGLNVMARWMPRIPGNGDEQDEPAGYEIDKILCKGCDVTFLFSEDDLELLQEALVDG